MDETRTILHVDMDAFFASIEQLDRPELRGKPVLVGYDGPRGVVAAASYEARPSGCRSAMPMAVAKRLCPDAVVVSVRMSRYSEVSDKLFKVFDDFSPLVEPLSVDEAFIDVTGSRQLLGDGPTIARNLKRRVRDELRLTASVGIAPNKFLAKLASDLQKPDGLTRIGSENVDAILPPLPVTRLWGVGPVMGERLATLGIRTIGDLRLAPADLLASRLGEEAEHYIRLAHGLDDRPVTPDSQARSISHEHTFGQDMASAEELRSVLVRQVEAVARRVRRGGFKAQRVSLKIRLGDFKTISRSATLAEPTDTTHGLTQSARAIFDAWAADSFRPVRLIGFTAERLSADEPAQLNLFTDPKQPRHQAIDAATDRIVARFGKGAIHRGLAKDE
jgi:DNA polymerase-4